MEDWGARRGRTLPQAAASRGRWLVGLYIERENCGHVSLADKFRKGTGDI
jgi:hypothetical protein